MAEPFIGEIRTFSFGFAPKGWATCNGQLLAISQNTALFSLLGTQYGGDGRVTFALPDLRGRVAIGQGTSTTGSTYVIGEADGLETVQLTTAEIPAHTHGWPVCSVPGTADVEKGGAPNEPISTGYLAFNAATPDQALGAGSTTVTPPGPTTGHNNMAPYLGVTFAIALVGIFPSRN